MKILQINTTVGTGSTGQIAEDIGQKAINKGHDSYIAYSRKGLTKSNSNLVKIGNKLDVLFHLIKTRLLDLHGFGSKRATRNFVEEIKDINPDVVGLHNLHGYYLNIEVLFTFFKNIQKPIIWTFHDCWPFTGHCSYFDYVSCEKWKTECINCPLTDKYPSSWLKDNSKKNFYRKQELFNGLDNLTIVTPSHWLKNLVSKSFLSDYPVKVIHNGINLNQFKPKDNIELISKYDLVGKKIILGVASVWDRRKGFNYFLELNKLLDDTFRIILIGLPEVKIKRLPENIIGIQRTENIDELVSFYNIADVFVNPTLVDNFPTTNLEALACGTPVITFNTGGSPESIDQNTGIVVPQGDVKNLYKSITNILENSRQIYRVNCRNRAVNHFDKEDRFNDYLNLYQYVSN